MRYVFSFLPNSLFNFSFKLFCEITSCSNVLASLSEGKEKKSRVMSSRVKEFKKRKRSAVAADGEDDNLPALSILLKKHKLTSLIDSIAASTNDRDSTEFVTNVEKSEFGNVTTQEQQPFEELHTIEKPQNLIITEKQYNEYISGLTGIPATPVFMVNLCYAALRHSTPNRRT
jgi:hypothetical protein